MESVSTLFEGERNYFSGTYVSEEADFMAQLLGNFSTKAPKVSTFEGSSSSSSAFWSHYEQPSMKDDEASVSMSISDNTNTNITMPYLQKSYSDCIHSAFFPTSSGESFPSIGSIKKRSCSMDDVRVDWKKTKFTSVNDSDDDSNRLQDLSPRPKGVEMVNSNGKKKASSGSTDSQSVYAKKRRERINERLRILQGLVPNGTKVDISTMLEEAVQYVKFLQLQIKLLSSDDMWMYAPLAYNGMDIGLDMKFPSPR